MNPEIAERLTHRKIQLLAEAARHYLFGRDACIALVERTNAGFGSIGSTGMMTDNGLAYLVWREKRAFLVGKGRETPAGPAELEAIERFSQDLKAALTS